MARRILAITLLIAFGFPLVAPAITAADPEASLPPCCRSHGAHHCAMMHMMLLALSDKPAFVPQPCPYYPTTSTTPQLCDASLTGPVVLTVTLLREPALPAATARRAIPTVLASANLKRGPPTRPA